MFRFETVVYVFLVSVLTCTSALHNQSHAREKDREEGSTQRGAGRCDDSVIASLPASEKAKRTAYCDELDRAELERVRKSGSDECRDTEKEYTSARDTFSAACGSLGIPSGGKEGAIACSHQQDRCKCLDKNFEDDSGDLNCEEVRSSGSNTRSSQANNTGLIDLKAAEKQLKYCPQKSPDDTERYEKQLEKAQERVKELKKKLPEILTKGNEAQDLAAEKQNEAQRKAVEAQREFANELKEIKRKKEGDEQQAVAEMAQIRENMDKVDAQIRQLELSKIDAEVKLSEAKTQIELNCHATASAQVSRLQAERMTMIRAKKYNTGGFNAMMKSVGVSDRDAWERRAEVYYKRCLKSRPTRDSKQAAQNVYESTVRQIDSQVSAERKSRSRMEESLKQIMSTGGCTQSVTQPNGFTGESRMCRSMRQAQEDMAQAQRNATQQQQQIQTEIVTATKTAGTEKSDFANGVCGRPARTERRTSPLGQFARLPGPEAQKCDRRHPKSQGRPVLLV
ncbi:MAG: hypothetical protein HC883_04645 [Bdellovibrionaceae bacterium]|nr:hypothetical protein [Pseudobdellovibrionaceae bacterium]